MTTRLNRIAMLGVVLFTLAASLPTAHSEAALPTVTTLRLWDSAFNGHAAQVEPSPDGKRVFVTGEGVRGILTAAYDATTGSVLWSNLYEVAYEAYGTDIAVSPDGTRVFIAGYDYGSTIVTIAYDAATGARVWAERYNEIGYEGARAIAVAPDGESVYVTGFAEANDYLEFQTLAYAAATGSLRWSRLGPEGDARAMVLSSDGARVFITGQRYHGSYGYETVSLDTATGDQLWVSEYGSGSFALAVALSSDDTRVFVTGGGYKIVTVAYDARDGTQQWVAVRDTPSESEYAGKVAVTPDGTRVIVAGRGGPLNFYDATTIAYDAATGTQAWLQTYDAGDNDVATDLTLSPSGGEVFVTGASRLPVDPTNSFNFITIAYDTGTGQQLWGAREPLSDTREGAIAVSRDGARVFIAGHAETIAYCADVARKLANCLAGSP